jgi:hypothetical protein
MPISAKKTFFGVPIDAKGVTFLIAIPLEAFLTWN